MTSRVRVDPPDDQQSVLGGDFWPPLEKLQDEGRLFGIADVHTHLMTHLAFGGRGLWGTPDGPVEQALAPCHTLHGRWIPSRVAWADHWKRHSRGYPSFADWPTHDGLSHQQMHVEWIRRAWQGGVRLIVTFAVNNELLARLIGGQKPYDDATAIEQQTLATRELAARHADFIEIAYTPSDARRIIRSGRLALVLGVEVDSLAECGAPDLSQIQIERWFSRLRDLGIRHVFPLHLADNAIGGAATYYPLFDVVNRWLRGRAFELRENQSVDYTIGTQIALRLLAGRGVRRRYRRGVGHVNARGLSDFGRDIALPTLMRLGMVIDIDHMSAACVEDVLQIAERHDYPLVSGHCAFRELAFTSAETANELRLTNEYQRTPDQLLRLSRIGGLLGIGLTQGDLREWKRGPIEVSNDLAGSSKTWAQAYLYALDRLDGAAVAFGSDSNGLVGAPGPRFGPRAAAALNADRKRRHLRRHQRAAQEGAVGYGGIPQRLFHYRSHNPLTECITGSRRFDVNVDGVAHYGMIPDFLQDLRNVGVSPRWMAPLFSSAEAYVSLWERVYR